LDREVKAAILVGGESRRIGENKSLLRFGDSYLLDVIIQKTISAIDDAYLITNASFRCEGFSLPFITDIYAHKGPLGGIFTALSRIDAPFVFITAGDMPFIEPGLIRYMVGHMSSEHDAIVPLHNGHREPLFAVYSQKARPAIEDAIKEGTVSVHQLLSQLSVIGVDEQVSRSFGEHVFFNINTPSDYEEALRIWKHETN
jgi:molybdopterin-guanine dinucleotide biosynthesis protein A